MGKFAEFMDKVMADEAAKAEFGVVIGARKERELSDEDFQKIVELSEKLGAVVTLDEVKDFFTGNGRELSEEELAGVAGGAGGRSIQKSKTFFCPLCGEEIGTVEVNFCRGKAVDADYKKEDMRKMIVYHLSHEHPHIVMRDTTELEIEAALKKAEEMIDQSDWGKFISYYENVTVNW